jgi:uncharacterized protein (DUF736 family)
MIMTQIGSFRRTSDGYEGRLHSLNLDMTLCLFAAPSSDTEHAPDWRIHRSDCDNGPEVGAGWNRTGEKAGAYIALLIDCPSLAQPIRANLFRSGADEDAWHLMWSRPSRRGERA